MPLRHLVLFRVHDDVPDAEVDATLTALRSLGVLPGVVSGRVERSLDERKGRVLVEDGTFVDDAALQAFRVSDEHAAVSRRLSRISDWWVGDYRL